MVVKQKTYIPNQGDFVWLDLDPQSGHEQSGKRPALVISPLLYNQKTGLALMCPLTTKIKGYPFEVLVTLKEGKSVVLADQIKNLDWQECKAKFIEKASKNVIQEVIAKLQTLITPI